jgi:dipeptidase E
LNVPDQQRLGRLMLVSGASTLTKVGIIPCEYGIAQFLGKGIKNVLYIPYAVGKKHFDQRFAAFAERFEKMGYALTSAHKERHPKEAIMNAEAVFIGDGNAWLLLYALQEEGLLMPLYTACLKDVPYVGVGAGAILTCTTIRTTDDWRIVEPQNSGGFRLVPFQINPDFADANPTANSHKTHEERIEEYQEQHPTHVVGLREGSWIRRENGLYMLGGRRTAKIFRSDGRTLEWSDQVLNGDLA